MGRIVSPGAAVAEAAVDRLERLTHRDREFEARFGKWVRPSWMRRYRLEDLGRLIRYTPFDEQVFDLVPFVRSFPPEERRLVGEVARFVFEEFEDAPATEKTLNVFRLTFLRRLSLLGF